ncbi:Ldb19 protein [Candida orthopsilosis Co 90-125]|uniref:Ldb19 protein n=1 Tax=Candida orthopsilosis (strain 90-125) TaxID=1136231 RepID=H8WWR5_CANO9|nr:Ldb19 protein [Candida orthopsilosis Co 90-125]CCG21055.1 Ldb19 protein [Candida orthopsilosis Co 90-125]
MTLLSKVFNNSSERSSSSLTSSHSRKLTPTSSRRSSSALSPMNSAASYSSSIAPTRTNTGRSAKSSSFPSTSPAYTLSIALESPPIILYGSPSESTGFIISGLLRLITTSEIELERVTLTLRQTMRYTKPFLIPNSSTIANCEECTNKTEELARWDVLTSHFKFAPGNHAYPFSHLLPGSLPPTSKLGSSSSHSFIKYDLIAEVVATDTVQDKRLVLPINISRSTLRGPDRNSLRVFPPTEVTASAVLPNVVYPKSTFPIELKLDNLVSASQQRRWRMRKLVWRIEENIKVKAHVCQKHAGKLDSLEKSYKKSPQKIEKPSGMHHSTVQTNVAFIYSPSTQSSNEPVLLENGLPDSVPIDDGTHDIEETVRTAPSNVHQSFLEDFGDASANVGPVENSAGSALTPQQSNRPTDAEKHLYMEETRTINYGEFKSGWKSDFSGRGRIEMVANVSANRLSTGSNNHITKVSTDDKVLADNDFKNGANISCDIDDPTLGVFVTHTLIVEVVVAEELVHHVDRRNPNNLHPTSSRDSVNLRRRSSSSSAPSNQSPNLAPTASNTAVKNNQLTGVPTGAARVLRMQFKLPITERSGLGIAWDDEVPPTYEDVRTLSPPNYQDQSVNITPTLGASSVQERSTPNVLYGRGETPIVGSFGLQGQNQQSLDGMMDNMQELSI